MAWSAALAGVLFAVLFAAVATSGTVRFAERGPSLARDPTTVDEVPLIALPEPLMIDAREQSQLELPAFVEVIARVVFYICLSIAAVFAAVFAWRHRPSWRWTIRRRRRPVDFDALDDVAASISADAAAQQEALRRGEPRNAIVECWLRVESSIVDAGIARDPSDTSTELTQRVLESQNLDPSAIATLASLYREARFSDHPMTEASRQRAIEALHAVHDGLRKSARSGHRSTIGTGL